MTRGDEAAAEKHPRATSVSAGVWRPAHRQGNRLRAPKVPLQCHLIGDTLAFGRKTMGDGARKEDMEW
jgi:hypothetical protein